MRKKKAIVAGHICLDITPVFPDQGMLLSEQASTSYTVVLAMPGNDRIFLHDPGANDTFCEMDLDWEQIAGADLFHFGYPPLMRRMYQKNGEDLFRHRRR